MRLSNGKSGFYVNCGHLFSEDVDASRPFLCRTYTIDLNMKGLEPTIVCHVVLYISVTEHSHGYFDFKKW